MNEKIRLLSKAPLFSDLGEKGLDVVARYSRFYRYRKGATIFSEGSVSKELYIIQDGEVLIKKNANGTAGLDLARFIEGETFGELDLLDSAPVSASAVTASDTTLLVFPARTKKLDDIIHSHPDVFAVVLHKLVAMVAGRIRTANKLISEKTPWIQNLRKQLMNDKLTGLYNRTYLEEELPSILARSNVSVGLLVVKPDNFKQINDTFGHEAGDRVLKLLAEHIKSVFESDALAVRYRGDEFAVVFPGAGVEDAVGHGERLLHAIKGMNLEEITGRKGFVLTASVGAATFPLHVNEVARLAARAHEFMLDARSAGGDRIRTVI